jgi:hypothetical protein
VPVVACRRREVIDSPDDSAELAALRRWQQHKDIAPDRLRVPAARRLYLRPGPAARMGIMHSMADLTEFLALLRSHNT